MWCRDNRVLHADELENEEKKRERKQRTKKERRIICKTTISLVQCRKTDASLIHQLVRIITGQISIYSRLFAILRDESGNLAKEFVWSFFFCYAFADTNTYTTIRLRYQAHSCRWFIGYGEETMRNCYRRLKGRQTNFSSRRKNFNLDEISSRQPKCNENRVSQSV